MVRTVYTGFFLSIKNLLMGLLCVSIASSGTSCKYGSPICICGDLRSEDDTGGGHDVIHCLHMPLLKIFEYIKV